MLITNGQFAPIAYADEFPSGTQFNYYPSTSIKLTSQWASYAAIYKTQVWVATLVNKVAFSTARLPLKVYERDGQGRAEARDTPFARLLRQPNRRHDPFFFWLWTQSTLEVYGEALWVKMRPAPGEPPAELWPLHPSNVFTRRDEQGNLVYAYHIGSTQNPVMEWASADIVHFKGYNPEDQIRGLSRLEPLRSTILSEDAARRASTAFWANGARPAVVMEHPKTISDEAQRRLKASWNAAYSGVDSWGKTAILEEGMKANIIPLNAEEMQYIESRKLNREEACGIYDIPPPAVHILDRATFSNITEQNRMLYRDAMAPRLGLNESVIDTQLRPDFDPQGTLYAEFLLDEVLRGDFEQRAAAYETMTRIAGMTPGEVRERENLPDLGPDTHRLYVNAATIPLGTAAGANPPGEEVQVHPQAVKTLKSCCACENYTESVSKRGLCRSCEGKAARALARSVNAKEIAP